MDENVRAPAVRALCVIAAVAAGGCAPRSPASPGQAALACGPGLSVARRATPRGIDAWCEDERGVRAGPFERRLPRGQLVERGSYAAGVLDGDYASFYPGGAPRARGRYARGLLDGAWRTWHDNGKPWLEVTYAAGEPTGAWLEYDWTGAKMFEGSYRDGRLDGAWRGYRDGRLDAIGTSVAGRLDGTVTVTPPDGTRLDVPYRDNRPHGTATIHDQDGKVVRTVIFVDGVEQGGDAR